MKQTIVEEKNRQIAQIMSKLELHSFGELNHSLNSKSPIRSSNGRNRNQTVFILIENHV